MIAAVVVLAGAIVVLAAVTGSLVISHQRERDEWASERRALVDRAIARHSGEIIALDREAHKGDQPPTEREPPRYIEGLS